MIKDVKRLQPTPYRL